MLVVGTCGIHMGISWISTFVIKYLSLIERVGVAGLFIRESKTADSKDPKIHGSSIPSNTDPSMKRQLDLHEFQRARNLDTALKVLFIFYISVQASTEFIPVWYSTLRLI